MIRATYLTENKPSVFKLQKEFSFEHFYLSAGYLFGLEHFCGQNKPSVFEIQKGFSFEHFNLSEGYLFGLEHFCWAQNQNVFEGFWNLFSFFPMVSIPVIQRIALININLRNSHKTKCLYQRVDRKIIMTKWYKALWIQKNIVILIYDHHLLFR